MVNSVEELRQILGGRFPGATRRNIFVTTPKAAERVMARISKYIESRLKLAVNREKSQVARSDRVKFLGFTIVGETIAIAHNALHGAMAKVKELTRDNPEQQVRVGQLEALINQRGQITADILARPPGQAGEYQIEWLLRPP